MTGPSQCCLCYKEDETIDHLLDRCTMVSSLWDRGEEKFIKSVRVRGRLDLTLATWPYQVFKRKLLNRMWELFAGFVVWELWKDRNRWFFEEKNRTIEEFWLLIELHLKEMLTLTQWKSEAIKEMNKQKILNDWGIFSLPVSIGSSRALVSPP